MSRWLKVIIIFLLLSSFGSAINYFSQGIFIGAERFAKTSEKDIFGDVTKEIVYVEQNWSKRDSLWFYNTTQGSAWMPYDIFLHLEQAENEALFRNDANMSRYRYLLQASSKTNPDGLPVGFVKDHYQGKDYVGFTCAACHTAQLDYNGIGIRIDGAPALADMDSMLRQLELALKASLDNATKFDRLANNVLDAVNADAKATFKAELTTFYEKQKLYNQQNNPLNKGLKVDYGFARLDAFGRIFNRVLTHITPNDPENINPPNAPVSYPFLWDSPHADFVQWNGIGNNHGEGLAGLLGSLARNTGEVLGVFADFSVRKHDDRLHYETSANRYNLQLLERHLQTLQSPQWSKTVLPPINTALAQQGKAVYEEYKCGWCHSGDKNVLTENPTFKRDDDERFMISQFASLPWIRTDSQMAINALTYKGKSGIFQGEPLEKGSEKRFAAETAVVSALSKLTRGVIFAPEQDKPAWEQFFDKRYLLFTEFLYLKVPQTQRHNDFEIITDGNPAMFAAYRARTLNGIWATAPYLHNGSVPNLYELFLPACNASDTTQACRSNKFTLGSRDFDSIKVGLVSKSKADYPALFEFDTTQAGNSNKGHEYAAGITPLIKLDSKGKAIRNAEGKFESFTLPPIDDTKRKALVEYLKTL